MRLDNPATLDGYADPRLVLRAQQGDQGAMAILYECFFDRIYRYVLARIGSVPEAEDLTEEVFVRMLRSIASFQPQSGNESIGFSAWLFRIAHNLIVDRVRQDTYRESQLFLLQRSLPDTGAVDEELDRRWDQQELASAVASLTATQRDVITLRFAAGLSLSETADVLGKQLGNVKALQHNALAALRRLLETEDATEAQPSAEPALSPAVGDSSWTPLAAATHA
jgi:RNA polymerase sigma-70 factor, ECF subfamily